MLNVKILMLKMGGQKALALSLHEKANSLCFIANSCNFPTSHEATIKVV
tara:strand:+ start:10856 stop:11002 length:147 start_codon:yes stop_codon:yes gene_type:complete